jgi:histone H3/H4
MEIIVCVRNVYGNELIYPVCERAKLLTRLSGRKTFSPVDIETIEKLGFVVKVETPKIGNVKWPKMGLGV